jgi:hypothetical protein
MDFGRFLIYFTHLFSRKYENYRNEKRQETGKISMALNGFNLE